MNRGALLERVAAALVDAGLDTPAVDARWLVDHVLGDRTEGSRDDERQLRALVARRRRREPLQLIIGRTWFRDLELVCRPGVFIPRPETEVVAGLAIAAARAAATATGAVRILEPCTGTGAVALAIASEVAGAEVLATDRNAAAVDLARANLEALRAGRAGRARLAAGSSVRFACGELVAPAPRRWQGAVDVLVANPPYLPDRDRPTWQPEVAGHDPVDALVGGSDGHEVVDELLGIASRWLGPGGTVVIEIDERRGGDAAQAAEDAGLVDVRIERDLTGADRAVVARRTTTGAEPGGRP